MKTRTLSALLALAATAMAAPLFAQKQAPPEAGKPKGFSVPAPHKFTLDNGMAVTLVEYGTLPKVTVRLAVRTGNIDEKAGEVWLSDVMGDLLEDLDRAFVATGSPPPPWSRSPRSCSSGRRRSARPRATRTRRPV